MHIIKCEEYLIKNDDHKDVVATGSSVATQKNKLLEVMKKLSNTLIILVSLFFICSCQNKSKESRLIGTYHVRDNPSTIWTFYAKGVLTTNGRTGNFSGTYDWLDDENLSVKLDGIGALAGTIIFPIEKINNRGIYIIDDTSDEPMFIRK